jgi:hypothetical protein
MLVVKREIKVIMSDWRLVRLSSIKKRKSVIPNIAAKNVFVKLGTRRLNQSDSRGK